MGEFLQFYRMTTEQLLRLKKKILFPAYVPELQCAVCWRKYCNKYE